ncbi:hypothetical protein BOTBODRAFT_352682 [Botryobasidium botryosum FD-172 SS1]|uniref:Uncharacterized protein n=1 Tax=Botryobasidium botryosum (strain FD-172 SS1) TaxID=930990 RepID=A0A067MHI7_BOTB1|nr:hypothetical protein BOTBODRAFT_352682 [Botryobasidium botryosum FD-172 SS1]
MVTPVTKGAGDRRGPRLSYFQESHHSVSLALAVHSVRARRVAPLFAALRFFLSPPEQRLGQGSDRASAPYHE